MGKRVNDKDVFCPTGFKSRKFSGAAIRWDIHKKKAFIGSKGVKVSAYYLHDKEFVIETDHKNLLYMEKPEAAIVIRWRIYLQGFMVFFVIPLGSTTFQIGVLACACLEIGEHGMLTTWIRYSPY